jgi:hypothetical protein
MKQLVCRSMVHPHQQFPGIAQCLNPALSLSSRSQVWTSFCQRRIASTLCRCGRAFDNGIVEVIGNDSRLLLTFGIVQNSEQLRAAGRGQEKSPGGKNNAWSSGTESISLEQPGKEQSSQLLPVGADGSHPSDWTWTLVSGPHLSVHALPMIISRRLHLIDTPRRHLTASPKGPKTRTPSRPAATKEVQEQGAHCAHLTLAANSTFLSSQTTKNFVSQYFSTFLLSLIPSQLPYFDTSFIFHRHWEQDNCLPRDRPCVVRHIRNPLDPTLVHFSCDPNPVLDAHLSRSLPSLDCESGLRPSLLQSWRCPR